MRIIIVEMINYHSVKIAFVVFCSNATNIVVSFENSQTVVISKNTLFFVSTKGSRFALNKCFLSTTGHLRNNVIQFSESSRGFILTKWIDSHPVWVLPNWIVTVHPVMSLSAGKPSCVLFPHHSRQSKSGFRSHIVETRRTRPSKKHIFSTLSHYM